MLKTKEEINKDIINRLNDLIFILKTDYKEIINVLDYSDTSYIHKVLNGKKIIEISTILPWAKTGSSLLICKRFCC